MKCLYKPSKKKEDDNKKKMMIKNSEKKADPKSEKDRTQKEKKEKEKQREKEMESEMNLTSKKKVKAGEEESDGQSKCGVKMWVAAILSVAYIGFCNILVLVIATNSSYNFNNALIITFGL